MTARIACSEGLNNTDLDTESVEVKRKLAFDLTDNLIIPLQKFRYGLETLRKLDPLPPNLETIIQQVAAEIERRQQ